MMTRFCKQRLYLVLIIATMLSQTFGYTASPMPSNNRRSTADTRRTPTKPGKESRTAQKMLKTFGPEQERRIRTKLSQSVLASCDTLPSFPTAHGILSPETVSRMNEMSSGGYGNEAVSMFLDSYRRNGPMSCLEMLSDPNVLRHLTKAMRDIA